MRLHVHFYQTNHYETQIQLPVAVQTMLKNKIFRMEKTTLNLFKYLMAAILFYAGVASSEAQTKKVFAHYMVCNKSYGNGSVAGYKQDIQDAQNAGVDGFALNTGGWDASYQQNMANLFQAASELGTDFKFFLSIDRCCGLTDPQILAMITSYANHPNYFKYNNSSWLSAWAGGGGVAERDWWINNILNPLKNSGYSIYFIPFLFTSDFDETPDYNKYLSNYNTWWKNLLNGYFYFGAVGLPSYSDPSLLATGEAAAKVFHDNGNTYMGTVSPYYWGEKQTSAGRRYYEFHGGEGIAAQWKSIMDIQKPEWIELTTWNDWGEGTYSSPMDDINKYWPYAGHPQLGFYKTHRGFAELNKFYINWYKSGVQPSIANDNIYFFYRTHPKDLAAANDPLGAVTWRYGDVNDEIHVTTILTAPAELRVITGADTNIFNVGAGIVHTRIPFNTGTQSFELWRNGVRVIQKQGENILSSITEYDFNVYSDFAASATESSPVPAPTVQTGAADLVVTNISMSPSDPSPGTAVTFSAIVKNQGTAATPEGTIVGALFSVDGVGTVWSSSYSALAAGASMTLTANGSSTGVITWPASAGNHTVEAFVDDVNRIAESNESNNKLSQSFVVAQSGTPDLIVTNVSWTPANPLPGQSVTFSATVKNQGPVATPAGTIIGVLFSVDNAGTVWSSTYSSLAAGASMNLTANGSASGVITWPATPGNHTIEAFADDVNRIAESNESNNKLGKSMFVPTAPGTGLAGQYFDNMDFTNPKLSRTDTVINFNWGSGSPVSTMGPDQFSVRWTGQVQPKYSETYTFYTNSDDGVRLWVNGQQIINNWTDHAPTVNKGTISLVAGQKYDIKMEFYENGGGAIAGLSWSSISQGKQVIPKAQLYNTSGVARIALLDEPEVTAETAIYPNPAQGEISVIYHSALNTEIGILINDINSITRFNKKFSVTEGENLLVLDISNLIPGMYFVNIISGDKKITKKIIVN
jgi:glucan endo-1,3-alpha-glucosidase